MAPLSSYFTWSLPTLPALPSIFQLSLPDNIQKRFISYILKRTLGRFVKGNGLDVERIEAQLGEGGIQLDRLEVDAGAVNDLIPPSIPLTFRSGTLSRISAKLPLQNPWGQNLSLSIHTLSLALSLHPSPATTSPPNPFSPSPPNPLDLDLAASVVHVAQEFVETELDAFEEATLHRSIQDSLLLSPKPKHKTPPESSPDPFNSPGSSDSEGFSAPGAFPFPSAGEPVDASNAGVLAGLIERILARLRIEVENIIIRVQFSSAPSADGIDDAPSAVFELRLSKIRYSDESSAPTTQQGRPAIVRALRIGGIEFLMLDTSPAPPTPETRDRRRSSTNSSMGDSESTASVRTLSGLAPAPLPVSPRKEEDSDTDTDTEEGAGEAEMMMSMAIADLRDSRVEVDAASSSAGLGGERAADLEVSEVRRDSNEDDEDDDEGGESLYESAVDGRSEFGGFDEETVLEHPIEDPFVTHTEVEDEPGPTPTLDSPVVVEEKEIEPEGERVMSFGSQETVLRFTTEFDALGKAESGIGLEVGEITVLLVPWQIRILSLVSQVWSSGVVRSNGVNAEEGKKGEGAMNAKVEVKGVWVGVVHQGRSLDGVEPETLSNFWEAPNTIILPLDHLRLHLSSLSATPIAGLISHLSLFEHLISDPTTSPPTGHPFPILVVDPQLGKQYEMVDGVAAELEGQIQPKPRNWPKFAYGDWRAVGKGGGRRGWERERKGGEAGKGEEAVVVRYGDSDVPTLWLAPLHLFVDLSLVERMLPLLQSVVDVLEEHRIRLRASGRQSSSPRNTMASRASRQSSSAPVVTPSSSDTLTIECPVLRFDLRCPAPVVEGQTWGDGDHLRSGIVTFDMHGFDASFKSSIGLAVPADRGGTIPPTTRTTVTARWEQLLFFFCRTGRPNAVAHLITGPLKLQPEDAIGGRLALIPSLVYRSSDSLGTASGPGIDLHVPSVRAFIDHDVTEGLQFFADDLTRWLEGAFGDGASVPRDDIRLIGSRFFGPVVSPASSLSDESKKDTSWTVRLTIAEVELRLAPQLASTAPSTSTRHHRNIVSLASDLSITAKSLSSEFKTELLLESDISSMTLADVLESGAVVELLQRSRRIGLSLNPKPFLSLRLSSSKILLSNTKETAIKLHLAGFTWRLSPELAWAYDLAFMAKTPPGVFEDVAPSEITKLQVSMENISILLPGISHKGAMLVYLAQLDVKTTLVAGVSNKSVKLELASAELLAVDQFTGASSGDHDHPPSSSSSGVSIWQRQGFVTVMRLTALEAGILLRGDASLDIRSSQQALIIGCCADSLVTLMALLSDTSKSWSKADAASLNPPLKPQAPEFDVFGSVDESAFETHIDPLSEMDMMADDLPSDPHYLANLGKPATIGRHGIKSPMLDGFDLPENEIPHPSPDHKADVKIKILYHGLVDLEGDYWEAVATKPPTASRPPALTLSSTTTEFGIHLYDGYDWEQTRTTIETEIKAVKRKLQKLKQLLSSGQQPDGSFQAGGSVLFDSINIGLDEDEDQTDQTRLLAAVNTQLDDMNAESEVGSQSDTWQAIVPPEGTRPMPVSKRKRKLLRSSRPSMEIRLRSTALKHTQFRGNIEMVARSTIRVEALDILDHIKTSTWKKFLTEMRSDGKKEIRETDVSMIDIDLAQVRPTLGEPDTELRLLVDVLPLRLHVDQDALDFMTKFFAFKLPGDPPASELPTVTAGAARVEPYFQHVEISPVKLKLDYKPKRVNMRALRKGRTMELMNFFHFEATEMTLRHLTLSGVSGWPTLFDTLNDVWAPDVKANQIADVVSGIAPIRSLVNVGSGMANLVLLPVEHYRRDGTVSRGVQRGAKSFLKSTAMEALKLGAQLATGTQVVLERATHVLGGDFDRPIRAETMGEEAEQGPISRYAQQPRNLREGVSGAYESMARNVNAAAQTILAIPMEIDETSENGTVRAVIRAVPIAMLQPMIGATEAVSKTLFGLRNEIDPRALRELEQKYKSGA